MRLVYFPKFCRTIVSIFLWVLHSSQEKIEDDRLAIIIIFFWGGWGRVYRVQIVNSNFQPLVGGTCMVRVVVNICGLTNK